MKKYKINAVVEATGISEDAIRGYLNNRNESTKGGIDLEQILRVIKRRIRVTDTCADPKEVEELKTILKSVGAIE